MRKRVFVCLLLCALLLASLSLTAHAEAQLGFVSDYALILSETERSALADRAASLAGQYGFPVYIVVVQDYRDYVNGTIADFSEGVFHQYGLGAGSSEDGLILALSMAERDYDLYAHGDFGNYAFTDYGKEQLAARFLDNFRRDDWAGGFSDYLDASAEMIAAARSGNPVDQWIPDPVIETPRGITPGELILILALPSLIALIVVGAFKKQMKTAVAQTRAGNYVAQNGVKLRAQEDSFLNRTVTHQTVPRNEPSSSSRPGGHYGGTSISGSHGGSHHSGKF